MRAGDKFKFKKIKKVITDIILLVSNWFGLTMFFLLLYFIINILLISTSCTEVVNGVCQVSAATDKRILNGSYVIAVVTAPLAYLIYKKTPRLFYVVGILSFLLALAIFVFK